MEIILGVIVSLFVQGIKKQFTTPFAVIAACAILSIVAAAVYTYLVDANLWQAVAGIFVTAGAFYTYIIARFENKTADASTLIDFTS